MFIKGATMKTVSHTILGTVSLCAVMGLLFSTGSQAVTIPETHCIDAGCDDVRSNSRDTYTPPARDYEAERRAREAEEARQAEIERQRKDAEDRRIKEEIAKKKKFEEERDAAASQMKGSHGMKITPNVPGASELKGSTGSTSGLKDALNDTGLRGSKPAASSDQGKQAAAWKQLNCASYIAGYALSALQEKGDYQEFGTLSTEALKAMDGQRTDVECPSAPPIPDLSGRTVDMESLQGKEKQILERAAAIAERMKQGTPKQPEAKTPVPANETEMEKMRRVQKELNRTNEGPIRNQKDEENRKEVTNLILEHDKLKTSIYFDTKDSKMTEEAPAKTRRGKIEVPSPK